MEMISKKETTLTEEEVQKLYTWVDEIPLSRPKKNIARDFSDGVLMAEVLKHFFPKMVELHNYSPANATSQKSYNWNTLNQKVLRRLGIEVSPEEIESLVQGVPGHIEKLLRFVQIAVERKHTEKIRKLKDRKQEQFTALQTVSPTSQESKIPSKLFNSEPSVNYKADAHIQQIIAKKDQTIIEQQEQIQNLELRIMKLEQLVQIKDNKIAKLTAQKNKR